MQEEDKKMRSYAVVPPMMLDARQRKMRFLNNNGLIEDPMEQYKEGQQVVKWTDQERQVFKEKHLQHPKNFVLIAQYLPRKVTVDIYLQSPLLIKMFYVITPAAPEELRAHSAVPAQKGNSWHLSTVTATD